jgi:predicted nucleotidyltransferase
MDIRELIKDKREDILQIADKYGARDVRIIGSVARNEEGIESDVDLLVRFDPGRSLLEHAAMMEELRELLGRKVDVASEQGLRDRVRERVLNEAVVL